MEDDWGTQKTTPDLAKTTKDEVTPGGMVMKGAEEDWMGGAVVEGNSPGRQTARRDVLLKHVPFLCFDQH